MDIAAVLKAISEPTRFKIITLLRTRNHCSRSLALTLGISESAVSQHMSVLKEAGIVTSFRHGYHIHYVLNADTFNALIAELNALVGDLSQIGDCHNVNPCEFLLDDGSNGCLYRSNKEED